MISLSELKKKITSLKSTLKTIMVMKMSATADLKKSKNTYTDYFNIMSEILSIKNNISKYIYDCGSSNIIDLLYRNENQSNGKTLFIYFSSDKGLCGGLNTKLIKLLDSENYKNLKDCEIISIGKKSSIQIPKIELKYKELHQFHYKGNLSEDIDANQITEKIFEIISKSYVSDIRFVFNRYVNTLRQDQMNISISEFESFFENSYSDTEENYLYSTKVEEFCEFFLKRYVFYITKYCILQNKLSESAMRMMAMDVAEDNCNDMISKMSTKYNKGRQEKITLELIDIISGMQ